jgi:ABC-2 type transport system permease protein
MNATQITKKDLLLLWRDRRTLLVLVALPLVFISILGFSTGQLFSEGEKNRTRQVALVDADKTELSTMIVAEVHNIKALHITEFSDRSTASMALAQDKVDVMLIIGSKYHERVDEVTLWDLFHTDEGRLAGKLKGLDIEVQSGSFLATASELVKELVFSFALRTMAPTVLKKYPTIARQIAIQARKDQEKLKDQEEEKIEELETANAQQPIKSEPASKGPNIVYQILVPSYTVMFVFFIVNFMARSFINEREMGTLGRLRLAPITRSGLLLGKTVPFLVISLVQTALLFTAGKVLFHMSWGAEPLMLVPVMVCTSLAATALGLMVATIAQTEAQVSAYGNFLVLTMAGISGCMMPRSWQPALMQQVGLITPHAWALIAYDQLLSREMTDMTVVVECCLTLLAFAAGFFTFGWFRFRDVD